MSKIKNVDYDPKTGIFYKHNYKSDFYLAEKIIELYPNVSTVADLGAGKGIYCKFFEENSNWVIEGYEGNKDACENKENKNMYNYDLTKDLKIDRKYDLVICLEVGEHIPKKFQNVFIENVTKLTKNHLILSWAVPKQGGKGHVNCLSNEKVIDLIINKGFLYDEEKSIILRKNSTLKFFKNTIMTFSRN